MWQSSNEARSPHSWLGPHRKADVTRLYSAIGESVPYKVIPFKANIVAGEGAANAASQLEQMVNQQATQGWAFHSLETLETNVTTPGQPGTSGCIGIGATPATPAVSKSTPYYVAVFNKD